MLRRRVAEVHNAQKELEFEKKLKEEKKKILRMKGTELEVAVSRALRPLLHTTPVSHTIEPYNNRT